MPVRRTVRSPFRPRAKKCLRVFWHGWVTHRRRDQLRGDRRPTEAPVRATTTRVTSTTPLTESHLSRSSIRDVLPFGNEHNCRFFERKGEHIRCPDKVAVPDTAAQTTGPATTAHLLLLPTGGIGTRATGPPLRACPDRYSGSRPLLLEVAHVRTVPPLGHALVVMSARCMTTDTIGIAYVEFTHPLRLRLLDHQAHAFVAQVAHLSLNLAGDAVPCALKFAPLTRVFRAACLLLLQSTDSPITPLHDGADATTGDDQAAARVGHESRLVDLAHVHAPTPTMRSMASSLDCGRCPLRDTDM